MLPSLLMGQHSPQPVGMARSSSSKYISMRRVLQGVSTSGVLMEESLSPVSSSWMTIAPTSLMYSTGSMWSLAAASTQSSRFGPVRAGPACRPSPSTGWGRTWGSGSWLTWTPLPGTWWLTSAWYSSVEQGWSGEPWWSVWGSLPPLHPSCPSDVLVQTADGEEVSM